MYSSSSSRNFHFKKFTFFVCDFLDIEYYGEFSIFFWWNTQFFIILNLIKIQSVLTD